MKYTELTEKSDLSCEGCCFNREIFITKYDKKGGKYIPKSKESKHQWSCEAPFREPFNSCKARHVIFQIAPSE